MSNGMRVDLSALDEVIRKLWTLLDDMDKAGTTSKYETEIPPNAFGHEDFLEGGDLHNAHGDVKIKIERMIKDLHGLIDDFGTKTSKVRDRYSNEEHEIKQGVGGGSGGSTKADLT